MGVGVGVGKETSRVPRILASEKLVLRAGFLNLVVCGVFALLCFSSFCDF